MDKADLETTLELRPRFDERGLVQAVATDAATGELLMVAHMNEAALERTLATGEAHYWSRSRREVWHKGGTCLLYTSPSPRDRQKSRMPSSA